MRDQLEDEDCCHRLLLLLTWLQPITGRGVNRDANPNCLCDRLVDCDRRLVCPCSIALVIAIRFHHNNKNAALVVNVYAICRLGRLDKVSKFKTLK